MICIIPPTLPISFTLPAVLYFRFALKRDDALISNIAVSWIGVHHFSPVIVHVLNAIKSKPLERN